MNVDFTASNLYAILLFFLHRNNHGMSLLTAREVLVLAAALAQTQLARFSLALGAALLLGATIRALLVVSKSLHSSQIAHNGDPTNVGIVFISDVRVGVAGWK
jgi:hypothetical protein